MVSIYSNGGTEIIMPKSFFNCLIIHVKALPDMKKALKDLQIDTILNSQISEMTFGHKTNYIKYIALHVCQFRAQINFWISLGPFTLHQSFYVMKF